MRINLQQIAGVVVLALVSGALSEVSSQRRRQDQQLTDELYRLVDSRTQSIKDGIRESKNEWAGTYVAGDHHPTVFMWTPEKGFLVTSSLHTFSPSWINYGGVTLSPTLLTILPELPDDNQYAHTMDTSFTLVRWGTDHFLVPRVELMSFAYAVHSRDEYEIGNYFARMEDPDGPRRGLPELPSEYQRYLKMPPITARIKSIDNEADYLARVTIDAGRRNGIIKGMRLYYAVRGAHASLNVTEVSERTAKAHVASIGSNTGRNVRVRIGWRFSSRAPYGFIGPG